MPRFLISFAYDPGWRAAAIARRAHQISVSLPVGAEGPLDATAYVAGLLPDIVRHRDLLADQLGIAEDPSDFAFLSKLGRDRAGALVILPEGEGLARSSAPAVDWLGEARLGGADSDPRRGELSVSSPIGKALLGLTAGTKTEYRAGPVRRRIDLHAVDNRLVLSRLGAAADPEGAPEPVRFAKFFLGSYSGLRYQGAKRAAVPAPQGDETCPNRPPSRPRRRRTPAPPTRSPPPSRTGFT